MTGASRSAVSKGLRCLCALLVGALFVFPLYYAVVSSLQTPSQLFHSPPYLYPHSPSASSFGQALSQAPVGTWLVNSVIVAFGTEVLTLPLAILAAYGLARLNFFGRDALARSMLIIYMFPSVLLLIPVFELYTRSI